MDRNKFINDNTGLVHACAKRFSGRGIEYEDLFQAGCLGLIKAVDNFDETRGFKFSTYAVPVILGEIKKLFRDGGAIKIGRTLKELSVKANKKCSEFLSQEGRSPTINELAELLGIEPFQAVEALEASQLPMSLSAEDDSGNRELDLPIEPPQEKISEFIALEQVIDELNIEDKKIIKMRFFNKKTQTQTAELLGVTQVQISRREKRILTALRNKLT